MDAAHKETDRQIIALERRLLKLYANAEKSLQKRVTAYFERFAKQDAEKKKQLEKGDITEQEFLQWRLAQIARGKEFENLLDDVAGELLKANQTAVDMTGDAMPDAYMVNYNQEAEEVNQEEGAAIPLLLAAAGIALLRPTVKKKKDIAWNRKQFHAAVTSNILLNRPLTGNNSVCVASLKFTVKRNADTARTNARTFMTYAETKGRQAVYNAADDLGIHRVKIWRTVHDNRVRDAHAAMDGVSVPWTEDFIVDGHKMIGPGDRSAPAYLWYNCRCRIKSEKARV